VGAGEAVGGGGVDSASVDCHAMSPPTTPSPCLPCLSPSLSPPPSPSPPPRPCRSEQARQLVGEEWIQRHRKIVQQHQAMYQKLAWSKVRDSAAAPGHVPEAGLEQGER
ncbi:unnamed protein product, partial [Closterium sp. NIES-53]